MSTTEIFPILWGGLDKGGLDKGFYGIRISNSVSFSIKLNICLLILLMYIIYLCRIKLDESLLHEFYSNKQMSIRIKALLRKNKARI